MKELGRLAQLGEHLPYKEGVTGSIPVATTNSFDGSLAQSVEQRTFNPLVASSSLARPTRTTKNNRGSLAQLVEQRTLNP